MIMVYPRQKVKKKKKGLTKKHLNFIFKNTLKINQKKTKPWRILSQNSAAYLLWIRIVTVLNVDMIETF